MQESFKDAVNVEQRKLDSKGRIVIPSSIRKSLNLKVGDTIWVQEDEKMILFYLEQ